MCGPGFPDGFNADEGLLLAAETVGIRHRSWEPLLASKVKFDEAIVFVRVLEGILRALKVLRQNPLQRSPPVEHGAVVFFVFAQQPAGVVETIAGKVTAQQDSRAHLGYRWD